MEATEKVVLGKVWRRLMPLLFVLYVVNILDRSNLSFARLQMLDDLKLDEAVYAFGAGIFYLGYLAFEVPSNLILARTGARRWISRIMITWGLIACAMMAVRGPWGLYALRILLGFAEAGFFPGIILYLTYWFPARERAKAVAWFMAASPVTGIFGSPVSGAILQFMDGVGGLRGWHWLFLLEGAPAVVLGFVVLYYLTDRPHQAAWLEPAERDWLAARVGGEEMRRAQLHGLTLLRALADGRVWVLILLYFTVAVGSNASGFYLPKLTETRFPGYSTTELGFLVAVPHACAAVCMVLNGTHSDRTGERRWHVAVPAFVSALGWGLSAWVELPLASLFAFTLLQVGIMCMLPVFWALPTAFLSGVAAAGGIALINSLGNLGGFVGPNILGQFHKHTGSFQGGLLTIGLTMAVGGAVALAVRPDPGGARVKEGG